MPRPGPVEGNVSLQGIAESPPRTAGIPPFRTSPALASRQFDGAGASVTACRVDELTIIGHARHVRAIWRVRLSFREAETPEPITQKPASEGGSACPAGAGENLD